MTVVVDASLIVALVVADERQAAAQAHLDGWVESGEELHAPAVLPYEVANVLARLAFDGDLEADGIADTWSDLAALDVVLHLFDLTQDGPPSRRSPGSCGAATPPTRPTFAWRNISTQPCGPSTAPLPATRPTSGYPSSCSSDAD